jgi:outer membrane protein TolC
MVQANEAALRGARSGYSPTVDVSYGKQTFQGSGQGDYVAQVVVSVPIFQGGATRGAVGSAAANLEASQQILAETQLVLRERIQSFWAQRQSALERVKSSQTQIKTAQAVVAAYREQFEVGRRSLLDLLNIQSDLYSYQNIRASAELDAKIARARLMASTGQLSNAYLLTASSNGKAPAAVQVTAPRPTNDSTQGARGLRAAQAPIAPSAQSAQSSNWLNTR